MPLLVPCEELRPGMRLAEPFLWNARMMLPGGKSLTTDDIDILHRKYPDVTLKIGDPVLDSIAQFEDDGHEREVAFTAQKKVVQCMAQVQEKFSNRSSLATLNFTAVKNSVSGILDYLRDNPVSAALLNRCAGTDNYLGEHAGNVFYLCLVLGSAVRDYVCRERIRQTSASHLSMAVAMDLLPLGLGAMLSDIGLYPLQRVFAPGYELTEEDRKLLLQHPVAGSELLPDSLPAGVKMVVRGHHENCAGSGYPSRSAAADQHIFIRIVRICDAYEAATAAVYPQARSPCRALWEMSAGPYRGLYDQVLMKVFRGLIQPFPIGARLQLTDGRGAVVVRYNRKEPFQPQVIVAFDAAGERLPAEQLAKPVTLGEDNDLRIARYDREDVSYLYEEQTPVYDRPEHALTDLQSMAYP